MEGNICSGCLELLYSNTSRFTAVTNWNNKCTVYKTRTAVFYARKDEIVKAQFLYKQITEGNKNE